MSAGMARAVLACALGGTLVLGACADPFAGPSAEPAPGASAPSPGAGPSSGSVVSGGTAGAAAPGVGRTPVGAESPGDSRTDGASPTSGVGVAEEGRRAEGDRRALAEAEVDAVRRWPGRPVRRGRHAIVVGEGVASRGGSSTGGPTPTARAPFAPGERAPAGGASASVADVVRAADEAWSRCRNEWPTKEQVPPLVVLLPEANRPGSPSPVAPDPGAAAPAATTVVVGTAPAARAWVRLGARAWDELSTEGRVVVLTHECVHVALAASHRPDSPRWLVEGVADDVAYRRSSVPVSAVLMPLAQDVDAHGVPATLPRDADLDPAVADDAAARLGYARALSAVRTYTRLHGRDAALDLVRHGPPGGTAPGAWAELDRTLLPAWQEDLRRLARSATP